MLVVGREPDSERGVQVCPRGSRTRSAGLSKKFCEDVVVEWYTQSPETVSHRSNSGSEITHFTVIFFSVSMPGVLSAPVPYTAFSNRVAFPNVRAGGGGGIGASRSNRRRGLLGTRAIRKGVNQDHLLNSLPEFLFGL